MGRNQVSQGSDVRGAGRGNSKSKDSEEAKQVSCLPVFCVHLRFYLLFSLFPMD